MSAGSPPPATPRGRAAGAPRRRTSSAPSLRVERAYQREGYRVLAGMDEVGRGALAGPVSVGVVCIDEGCRPAPAGVRDSKLLSPARREALVPPVRRWALAWAVGHASPAEIDEVGIIGALRLAGRRALQACGVRPDLVLLDGKHDWLTDPAADGLLGLLDGAEPAPPVRTRIKADLSCASVAAASVLAKVERDGLMVAHATEFAEYGFEINKGYAAPGHLDALRRVGACELHRRTWNLAPHLGAAAGGEVERAGGDRPRGESLAAPAWGMVHDGPVEVRVDGR